MHIDPGSNGSLVDARFEIVAAAAEKDDAQLVRTDAARADRTEQRRRITALGIDEARVDDAKWEVGLGGVKRQRVKVAWVEAVHHRDDRQAIDTGIVSRPWLGHGHQPVGTAYGPRLEPAVDEAAPLGNERIGIVGPPVAKLRDPGYLRPCREDGHGDERGEWWTGDHDDVGSPAGLEPPQCLQEREDPAVVAIGDEDEFAVELGQPTLAGAAAGPPGRRRTRRCHAPPARQALAPGQRIDDRVDVDEGRPQDTLIAQVIGERAVRVRLGGGDDPNVVPQRCKIRSQLAQSDTGDRVVRWEVPGNQQYLHDLACTAASCALARVAMPR